MEMNEVKKLFHVGDIVLVKHNLEKTKNTYATNDNMLQLRGKRINISKIFWSKPHSTPCIEAGNWKWHPMDLHVARHKDQKDLVDLSAKIFKFDVSCLDNK